MWRYRMRSLYMTLTYAVWIGWYAVTDAVCRGCVKYVRMIGCGGSRGVPVAVWDDRGCTVIRWRTRHELYHQ